VGRVCVATSRQVEKNEPSMMINDHNTRVGIFVSGLSRVGRCTEAAGRHDRHDAVGYLCFRPSAVFLPRHGHRIVGLDLDNQRSGSPRSFLAIVNLMFGVVDETTDQEITRCCLLFRWRVDGRRVGEGVRPHVGGRGVVQASPASLYEYSCGVEAPRMEFGL